MGILSQRIRVAVIGLIFCGGIGALIAAMPVLPHATSTAQVSQTDTPTDVPTATPPPTQAPTATTVVDAGVVPTATSPATATATVATTATPGQATDFLGTITSIQTDDQIGFTFKLDAGGTVTVTVNGNTKYQGVSGFNALRTGMHADVKGTTGANSTLVASLVHTGV